MTKRTMRQRFDALVEEHKEKSKDAFGKGAGAVLYVYGEDAQDFLSWIRLLDGTGWLTIAKDGWICLGNNMELTMGYIHEEEPNLIGEPKPTSVAMGIKSFTRMFDKMEGACESGNSEVP